MVRLKALLPSTIGLFILVSCTTMPRPSSASPQLYENCPLRVPAGNSAGAPVADNAFKVPNAFRHIVIISDLHMGIGKDPKTGLWDNTEDFRWGAEFKLFLQEVDRLGEGKTDLVINGDTFELWQSAENDCRYANKNLGCTELEALHRIKRVLSQHQPELNALGRFADSGDNRLILIPGNHDVAILYPKVGKAVLTAIPAAEGRVRIASEGFWMSEDQRVYAEHGNQIGREVNCLSGWPKPFLQEGDLLHLQRPWGEQFVQEYFNDYEHKYQIIDNFIGELDGITYGLAAEGPAGIAKGVTNFFRVILFRVSWEQFGQSLAPTEKGKPPLWDVKAIREQQGDRFLVESLPMGDPFRESALNALEDNTLSLRLFNFSDDEILAICDRRAMQRSMKTGISECPQVNRKLGAGAEKLYLYGSRDSRFGDHLLNTHRLLALSYGVNRRFDIFVYGHTHNADKGFNPLKGKGNWNPTVVNSGAWQRVTNRKQFDKIVAARKLTVEEALEKISPEDLPACYSLVKVEHSGKVPVARLLYWQKEKDKGWGLSETCISSP